MWEKLRDRFISGFGFGLGMSCAFTFSSSLYPYLGSGDAPSRRSFKKKLD